MTNCTRSLAAPALILALAAAWGPTAPGAHAEAFCHITEVKHEAISNAVQIEVRADGILRWEWTFNNDGSRRRQIGVRFSNARLKLADHFIDVEQPPVSTVMLYVPQDAEGGTGVVMDVNLSERSSFKGTGSTDGRSFVLTIDAPLRTEDGPGRARTAAPPGQDQFLSVEVVDGLVTIRALRADIHEAIAEVARRSGLNVTLDDAVSHRINVNLTDMAPLDVIRAIAAGYGLALSTSGDVYMLSEGVPRDLKTYNRSGTASFPMRYLRAEDAKELLPTFLTRYVHFNEEQNAVVATAPDQMLDKIRRDLLSVDVPPPLIMVEVVAVELTDTEDYEREFSWLYSSADRRYGADSATGELSYRDGAGVIADSTRLTATLQALQTRGRANIRSTPRIAAVNGKTAEIFIGQDRFILVEYQVGGTQQERIEAVPVGVRLEVCPWTGGDGEITTRVDVEVSNISEIDPATSLPLLSSRKVSSTVRTRDGETIVIGGLRQQQTETTRRKVPLLGDIPILGALFQSKSVSSVDSELVIFVTPRILSADGQLLDASQEELQRRLLEPGDCGYLEK